MQTPTLPDVLSARVGVDYIEEPMVFFVGNTSTPDSFTGCTLKSGLWLNGKQVLDLSTPGWAAIQQPNTVTLSVPAASMPTAVGLYKVAHSLVLPSGAIQDLLVYSLRYGNID